MLAVLPSQQCALEDGALVDEVIKHLPAWMRNLSTCELTPCGVRPLFLLHCLDETVRQSDAGIVVRSEVGERMYTVGKYYLDDYRLAAEHGLMQKRRAEAGPRVSSHSSAKFEVRVLCHGLHFKFIGRSAAILHK